LLSRHFVSVVPSTRLKQYGNLAPAPLGVLARPTVCEATHCSVARYTTQNICYILRRNFSLLVHHLPARRWRVPRAICPATETVDRPPGDLWSGDPFWILVTVSATETFRYPPPAITIKLRGPTHCLDSTSVRGTRGSQGLLTAARLPAPRTRLADNVNSHDPQFGQYHFVSCFFFLRRPFRRGGVAYACRNNSEGCDYQPW